MRFMPEKRRPKQSTFCPADHSARAEVQLVTEYGGRAGSFAATEETGFVGVGSREKGGLYHIEVLYHPLPGKSIAAERGLLINGERPFEEVEYVVFPRVWADERPSLESTERQSRSGPAESKRRSGRPLCCGTAGYIVEPFQFYFKEGSQPLHLRSQAEPLLIGEVRLYHRKAVPTYAEVQERYRVAGLGPAGCLSRSGKMRLTNQSQLCLGCMTRRSTMEPYHPVESAPHRRLPLGAGQSMDQLEFTVPETGALQNRH